MPTSCLLLNLMGLKYKRKHKYAPEHLIDSVYTLKVKVSKLHTDDMYRDGLSTGISGHRLEDLMSVQ